MPEAMRPSAPEGILATFPEGGSRSPIIASDADFARFVGTADFVDGGGAGLQLRALPSTSSSKPGA